MVWNFLFEPIRNVYRRKLVDALVAELVDAQDLKSCLLQGEYGINSRLGHHKGKVGIISSLSFFIFLKTLSWRGYQRYRLILFCGSIPIIFKNQLFSEYRTYYMLFTG